MSSKVKRSSMQHELNGCLKVFEVMGLQAFSLKSLNAQSIDEWPCFLRSLYELVLLVVISSMMLLYMLRYQTNDNEKVTYKNIMMLIVQHSMNVGMVLTVSFGLIQSYCTTKMMKRVYWNTMEIVNLCFAEFGIEIDFRVIRKVFWIRFMSMVVFVNVVHFSVAFCSENEDEGKKMFDQQLFLGIIPVFFLNLVVYKFIFHVGMVNHQLVFLQGVLEHIFTSKPIKMMDNRHFHLTTILPVNVTNPDDPIKKLRSAWKLYNKIYESANLINDSFGLTILIILGCLVVTLTGSGYEVFVIAIGEIPTKRIPETVHVIILSTAIIISIVAYCQRTETIMGRLAMSLKIIECDFYDQHRYETREFLQNFYQQLTHQPVGFSAFGFYRINLALLASMMTGIVSYQIILVQFYSS